MARTEKGYPGHMILPSQVTSVKRNYQRLSMPPCRKEILKPAKGKTLVRLLGSSAIIFTASKKMPAIHYPAQLSQGLPGNNFAKAWRIYTVIFKATPGRKTIEAWLP